MRQRGCEHRRRLCQLGAGRGVHRLPPLRKAHEIPGPDPVGYGVRLRGGHTLHRILPGLPDRLHAAPADLKGAHHMNLPKRNSADGRCYWMKPEVQEELQPLFDQCIQDAIDGRITRLDSLWPPVVVSSEGAPFEVWQLIRTWTEAQRAETLDAEKAIAFSENLRRQSRWGEIDHHLLDMLQRELQEKYFIVTGNEDDHFWDREYSLKPGIRAEEVPE